MPRKGRFHDPDEGRRLSRCRRTGAITCQVCGALRFRLADALYCGKACNLRAYRLRKRAPSPMREAPPK